MRAYYVIAVILLGVFRAPTQLGAQRVRVPEGYGAAGTGAYGTSPVVPPSPAASLAPGIQPFDPYALPSNSPSLPPTLGYGPATTSPPPTIAPPPQLPAGTPTPPGTFPASPFASYGAGGVQPQTPLFSQNIVPQQVQRLQRLFQDTGFRYTWLAGDRRDELQMHDVELSTTAFFPNFLNQQGPLRVTPGFVFHFLDGPQPPVTSDLPSKLYSAYLDFGWSPQFTSQFGADVNFRSGVYSDFDTVTSDSVRFMGTGVGVVRVTPTTTMKIGASYIDRARVKLLPAVGILYQPNPQTKWDLFFPAPKIASYWTTIRNSQVWWYLAGEYGGGSWTIDREEAPKLDASERVDVNDIRVMLGLEWQNSDRWYGFFEVGYVFDRELYYVLVPADRVDLEDTFMIRTGVSF